MKRLAVFIVSMFLTGGVYAAPSTTITTPNSFSPNTVIQSSQVNSNFGEVQSKYNSHSHTDITQLGTVTTGGWNASVISTQFGGTGEDFSSTAQGSIIYFDGAGSVAALAPSTAGYSLTTNGAANNPTWTQLSGARDGISNGLEVSGSVGKAYIEVFPGTYYHGGTQVSIASSTVIDVTDGDWWASGSVVSYAGGAGWCYVGGDSSGRIKLLGKATPQKSDTSGNNFTHRRIYANRVDTTNTYWRIFGAVRMETTDTVQNTQQQTGNRVTYDNVYSNANVRILNAGAATAWTAVDCSAVVPAISKLISVDADASGMQNFHWRPTGSISTQGLFIHNDGNIYEFNDLALNSSQSGDYYVDANNVTLYVKDYTLDIR